MKLIKDISIGKLLFLFIFALIVGFSSMLPMVFLYELSIWISKMIEKRREEYD